jgi:hypothetical protein
MFDRLELRPERRNALTAGVAEPAAIELARRAAAEQADVSTPTGRFEHAVEVEQDVPAEHPA